MADNSIPKYSNPTKKESEDAAGVTQFPDEFSWNHVANGLIEQGGKALAAGAVAFSMPFKKQLLGVFVSAGTVTAETPAGFTASAPCYWRAVGV